MPPQAIPAPRPGTKEELPNIANLAVTPGGAHFLGTTPGGTRIIYDRNTLMHYRSSPLSKTPPGDFPVRDPLPPISFSATVWPHVAPRGPTWPHVDLIVTVCRP